jgi:hypothetical protein
MKRKYRTCPALSPFVSSKFSGGSAAQPTLASWRRILTELFLASTTNLHHRRPPINSWHKISPCTYSLSRIFSRIGTSDARNYECGSCRDLRVIQRFRPGMMNLPLFLRFHHLTHISSGLLAEQWKFNTSIMYQLTNGIHQGCLSLILA